MSAGSFLWGKNQCVPLIITSGGLKFYGEPRLLIRRLGMCKEAIKRVDLSWKSSFETLVSCFRCYPLSLSLVQEHATHFFNMVSSNVCR